MSNLPHLESPLRYPGGKRRLAPLLASVLEANGLTGGWYVEPYAGGAGAALYLLLRGHVRHIVINDADPMIHAFWQSVVHDCFRSSDPLADPDRTAAWVVLSWPTAPGDPGHARIASAHFRGIAATPDGHSTLELGFAAFFLNRTSRSGILTGGVIGGNSQTGTYRVDSRYRNLDDLVARVQAIGKVREHITVLGIDALDLLRDHVPGLPANTLFYLDPPYYEKGSQLYRNHYQPAGHKAIADFARHTDRHLLISYDDVPEIRDMYRGVSSSRFALRYSTHLARPLTNEVLFHTNVRLPEAPRPTKSAVLPSTQFAFDFFHATPYPPKQEIQQ